MTDEPRDGREAGADGDAEREGPRRGKPATAASVLIQNRLGLHARAAAQFVKMAAAYQAEIIVEAGSRKVNGKSIMGLLMLAAAQGTELRLKAAGPDADAALQALAALVAQRFGEPE